MATKKNFKQRTTRKPVKNVSPQLVYKDYPRAVSITVYDLQGDPISGEIKDLIADYALKQIKAMNIPSLAISVSEG